MSFRIYVAGAYSAPNILEVADNIRKGRDLAVNLLQMGFFPYCPWNDWELAVRMALPMEIWKANGMAWLEASEGMILVPGYESSHGTSDEMARARELDIPIFDNKADLIIAARSGKMFHRVCVAQSWPVGILRAGEAFHA
jgi:hypothetical protein